MRNNSLDPETGSLNKRLEHLPLAVPGKNTTPICHLHRFTSRQIVNGTDITDGTRDSVIRCFTYGINLCLPCFFLFHKTTDLEEAMRNIM